MTTPITGFDALLACVHTLREAADTGRALRPIEHWLLAIASGAHDPGPWPPRPGATAEDIIAEAEAVLRDLADLVDVAALDAIAARLRAIVERERAGA